MPLGEVVQVRLRRGTSGVRDGNMDSPDSRTLLGAFVAADDAALVLRVIRGAASGTWRLPRTRVERIERGRIVGDGPWEGVLGGFVGGAAFSAIAYLGSGGGEDHEIILPLGTLLFGAPAALVGGGLTDYFHRSLEITELVYDVRPVVPGN